MRTAGTGQLLSPPLKTTAKTVRQTTCRTVFAPKLASTVALAEATAQAPLTTHALFSSAASLLGAPGEFRGCHCILRLSLATVRRC